MSAVRRLWNRRLDLRWDLSASEIEQSVAVLEAKHRQVQDSVAQTALEAVDVGNTLQPLADCDAEVCICSWIQVPQLGQWMGCLTELMSH